MPRTLSTQHFLSPLCQLLKGSVFNAGVHAVTCLLSFGSIASMLTTKGWQRLLNPLMNRTAQVNGERSEIPTMQPSTLHRPGYLIKYLVITLYQEGKYIKYTCNSIISYLAILDREHTNYFSQAGSLFMIVNSNDHSQLTSSTSCMSLNLPIVKQLILFYELE
jgi:hypothetical protein